MVLPVVLVLGKVIDMLDEQIVIDFLAKFYYLDDRIDWDQSPGLSYSSRTAFPRASTAVSSILLAALDLQRSSAASSIEDTGAPSESTDES